MNLFDYLLDNGAPGDPAFIQDGATTTYGELRCMAEAVARSLAESGVSFQDRVGILAENSPFWAAAYLGILKTGAIATPLPSRLTADDLGRYSEAIACKAYCIDNFLLKKYSTFIPAKSVLVLKNNIINLKPETVEQGLKSTAGSLSTPVDPAKDLAALMFTSGSTGQPNAVKVTHQNIRANTDSIIAYLGLKADDRMMVILPFHYCFGTSLLHTHLRVGGSLVINNYFQYVEDVLNEMETSACTGFAGVPSTFQALLSNKSFRHRQFPDLRHVQQAGGKLSEKYINELRSLLPSRVKLYIGYGQTEATARLSALPPEKLGEKTGSIGHGIPGVSLQILNKHDMRVQQGEVGEIVAEGDNVTSGYLFPDPSKNPFRNGKLYTGDLAYADEDGYLYVVGREKDFIKPSGYKVMTATIESALLEIPEVAEAAVTGMPHEQLGEAAKAFVVVKQGHDLSIDQVLEFCKTKLPAYAVPRRIEFTHDLPKNSAGKILKNKL